MHQSCLTEINPRINQYLNPAVAWVFIGGGVGAGSYTGTQVNRLHQCKRAHVDQSQTLDPRVQPFPESGNPHPSPMSLLHDPEQMKFNPKVSLNLALV